MAKLILDYQTSGSGCTYVSHVAEGPPELDGNLLIAQGFIWYSDFVAFAGIGQLFSYWLKVYLANSLSLRPDVHRAILVPFTVPECGKLLAGSYMDLPPSFQIAPGEYKLLFETRFLTEEEIRSSKRYDFFLEDLNNPDIGVMEEDRPEMCFLTFIPTTEPVEPQIICPTPERLARLRMSNPIPGSFGTKETLLLYRERRPPDFD
jgi:hypothetical protein